MSKDLRVSRAQSRKEGGRGVYAEGVVCAKVLGGTAKVRHKDESQRWRQRGCSSRVDVAREADRSNHTESEATSKVCAFSLKVGYYRSNSSREGTQA